MSTYLGRSMIDEPALYFAVAGLFSESVEERERSTGEVGDFINALRSNAAAVTGALVIRAGLEENASCYERVLDTIADICAEYTIPLAVVAPLKAIEPSQPWEAEYLNDIFENAPH